MCGSHTCLTLLRVFLSVLLLEELDLNGRGRGPAILRPQLQLLARGRKQFPVDPWAEPACPPVVAVSRQLAAAAAATPMLPAPKLRL